MAQKKDIPRVYTWRLREFCEKKKGIMNAYQLQQATGLPYPMCRKLWSGEQKLVGMSTIGTLCDKLACESTDIMGWQPAKK